MTWPSEDTLVAGCTDHQVKVFDVNKLQVSDSLFTNHKVVTCLDSIAGPTILGGHEDGVVRLYDLRTAQVKQHRAFESSSSYASAVRICPRDSNLFAATSYDGRVRLWDMRNEHEPIHVLKRKGAEDKLFAVAWNGTGSQLACGGSDSNLTVYSF